MVKLTDEMKAGVRRWIQLHDEARELMCPFYGWCTFCQELFPEIKRLGKYYKCPCHVLDAERVMEIAKRLIQEEQNEEIKTEGSGV